MTAPDLQKMSFEDAMESSEAEVVESSGWHDPETLFSSTSDPCGCEKTTARGAYRDVVVEFTGGDHRVIHYYHQSPVVIVSPNAQNFRIDSCGWKTPSTLRRINRHLPGNFKVRQEAGEWVIDTPSGTERFKDGMVVSRQ